MTLLHTRADALASQHSGLGRLVEAHRTMTSDVSLSSLPARIADATCAALGAASGGMTFAGIEDGIREHVRDSTPVQVRGELFGELYVVPADGQSLNPDDRELLTALGAIAGTAIENALLHDESERSKDWLQASSEIARGVLSERSVDGLMDVVSRALHVAEADSGSLILPSVGGMLRIEIAAGIGANDFRGATINPQNSLLGQAVISGESLLVEDMSQVMRADYHNVHEYGPVMVAPLVDARGVRGAVVLARIRGRAPFTARDLDLATAFADQVAVALEMNDARARSEWVTVLEDRHRIAQDLHDNVMQRLFATGVGLQSLAAGGLSPELGKRLGRYIADLDETIDEIRDRVFGLLDGNGFPLMRAESRFPRVARVPVRPAESR